MIIAERKPMEEIAGFVAGKKKVLVLGCGGCVTVCLTGGDKQAELLASQLTLAAKTGATGAEYPSKTITRQCDREFLEPLKDEASAVDAVLSLACGVGVQLAAEILAPTPVLPAMNTTFMGESSRPGMWTETCRGCGQCMLAETAGICPVSRCSKSLVNGACGGTNKGKCEVSEDIDCAWYLIYNRLKERNALEQLKALRDPIRWSVSSSGAQRRMVLAELVEADDASAKAEA